MRANFHVGADKLSNWSVGVVRSIHILDSMWSCQFTCYQMISFNKSLVDEICCGP